MPEIESLELQKICAVIRTARVDLTNEKTTQADLETIFKDSGLRFSREVTLSKGDIVDFYFPDSETAVEVKLRGAQKMSVYRQLVRYAQKPHVKAIILVTNLCMGLPSIIEGKPAYYIALGEAWL